MKESISGAVVMVLVLGAFQGYAAPGPLLALDEGVNEVGITIVNRGAVDLDGVTLSVDAGALPPWIHILETPQPVSVPKLSRRSDRLTVRIDVQGAPDDAWVELPLRLRDHLGESWSVRVMARVTASVPPLYELAQNVPNPFNPETVIRYALTSKEVRPTQLVILNTLGQKVRTLVDAPQAAGWYAVRWDGRDEHGQQVASGVYVYRLRSGTFVATRKMLVTK